MEKLKREENIDDQLEQFKEFGFDINQIKKFFKEQEEDTKENKD